MKVWERAKGHNVEKYIDELREQHEDSISGIEDDWENFAITGDCAGIDCSVCPFCGTDTCNAPEEVLIEELNKEV